MAPTEHAKDPERVAAGLKASIKNPNVSPEAKAHAQQELDKLLKEQGSHHHAVPSTSPQGSNRVLGGYKATLHNEHTSEEAKKHAREILSAAGYTEREPDESEHTKRVLAGYKASLNNPRVSEEAKQHARDFLKQHEAYGERQSREILSAAGYHERVSDEAEHNKRVLAGYKAALINPNVSEEAKVHAREYLKEHGAL
ncbi:Conidiation-specific protein 6 [Hypsizygus marmoreus]|uniref:Conidiation-specific protein 6 n=1 Tax=Hypsizygus marmoreus TaxID=39966 RepID=A0A369JGM5_HYPMA|nr:Conidiation-specific protein 6 [Hypsizygus marmoreus]